MQIEEAPDFQTSWLTLHSHVPGWLYHYTTVDGLQGILRDRSMFGTHYRFLNDSLEITWGKQLVAKYIDEYIEAAEEPTRVALSIFQGTPREQYWDTYIACFCAEGNLLSQWRAYSNSGGYALAFRGMDLSLSQLPTRHLRKVIYEETEQIRWVKLALDWFVERIAAIRRMEDPAWAHAALDEAAGLMWRHLGEMCVSFKLHVFKEEAEWRIAEFVPKKERLNDVDNVKFRAKAGIPIPYRAFPIEVVRETRSIQSLDHVVCGPTLSREDVEQALTMFLRSEGYSGVWVTSSMIPINSALQ